MNINKPWQPWSKVFFSTHSERKAAHYGGFDFVGCELDEDYFKAAKERINQETKQIDIFGGATA